MTCPRVKPPLPYGARLAPIFALLAMGCSQTNDTSATDGVSSLRGGSDHTQHLKGLIDFSDDYNDWSSDLSRFHCSGLMLNQESVLTTVRCAEKVMRAGLTVDYTRGFLPDIYDWFTFGDGDPRPSGYYRRCAWDVMRPCSRADRLLYDDEGTPSGKIEKISLYSLASGPDNDLAILKRNYYPGQSAENDFADIYMDDFTPASMPRLQIYGWGRAPEVPVYPLPVPRTGTMQVLAVTPSHLELRPDQVQACSGDEGGVWVIPQSSGGTGNEVVALESSFTVDPATGCSQSGSIDYATRLRDKMAWIETVVGPCGSYRDAAGHNVKRCYASDCAPVSTTDPKGWDGCGSASGCSVCSEVIDSAYPKYFDHHRNCSRNTTCNGSFSRCSTTCPPPTPQDSCDGLPDGSAGTWEGCRGSGCSACSDLIDNIYPKYFLRHPDCARNTTCNGYHYRCSASCPMPTADDQ